MIDFHNHLLPGVDDGAGDLDQSRAAVAAMRDQGIRALIVTPHFNAALSERPEQLAERLRELDEAFELTRGMVSADFPEIQLERGVELMLDSPHPDLTNPSLRLAGTRFLLVEFPGMMVPPHGAQALYDLGLKGWKPIIAHPERYRNLHDIELVSEWRTVGCYIQVNSGSILGRYGSRAQKTAWALLGKGWVDYLCSDYHARGPVTVAECRDRLIASGGEGQARLLLEENGRRLLAGEEPNPVAPIRGRPPFWRRLLGRRQRS